MIHYMYAKRYDPPIYLDALDESGKPVDWSAQLQVLEGHVDGGVGMPRGRPSILSGLRFDEATLPRRIRYRCPPRVRRLPDVLEPAPVYMATRKLCSIVEAMEPGQHHIHPLSMTWKDGSPAEDRWLLIPTQRLDTGDRDRTTWVMRTNTARGWSWWEDPARDDKSLTPGRFIVDPKKVSGRHIWQDRHLLLSPHFVSDAFRRACEAAGVTGLGFTALADTDWAGVADG